MLSALVVGLALAPAAGFVAPDRAAALLAAGAAALDARDEAPFRRGHVPGAVRIDWKDYRDGWGRTGRLDDDPAALARRLGALGVDERRPVVVYGAARAGWGEEGRIAWMLVYLGHPEVHLIDGGFAAWRDAGRPIEPGPGRAAREGRFTARLRPEARADLASVRRALAGGATVLDVRSRAEWDGATPYHEPRGGHLPGARWLDWRELLDAGGRLRPPEEVRARLAAAGAAPGAPIVVYCTGGVRSAFAWAALRSAGVPDVRNYDGSFYEWSARRDLPVAVGDSN